jgi:hypothetical protein
MKINIFDSYAGSICHVHFEKQTDWFGIAVTIQGFIETNGTFLELFKSPGKFIVEDFKFKISKNIIPTFESKNFKIYYRLDCYLINKSTKFHFTVPLSIHNNNLIDFSEKEYQDTSSFFDLEIKDCEEYEKSKKLICEFLIEKQVNPLEEKITSPTSRFKNISSHIMDKIIDSLQIDNTCEISADNKKTLKPEDIENTYQAGNNQTVSENADLGVNINTVQMSNANTDQAVNITPNRVSYINIDPKINKDTEYEHHINLSDAIQANPNQLNSQHVINTNQINITNFENIHSRATSDTPHVNIVPDRNLLPESMKEFSTCAKTNCSDQSNSWKTNVDVKLKQTESFYKILQENLQMPTFSEPNILTITTENVSVFKIFEIENEIARVKLPEYFTSPSEIQIEFLKNIKNTKIEIWRQDFESGKLIDTEMVFFMSFDSEFCLEKIIHCSFEGYSIKNLIFEVKLIAILNLDDLEVIVPLKVLSPNCITSYSSR